MRLPEVLSTIDDWPVGTAAAGATDAEATLGSHGAVDTVLEFASVTKPLTAYAVLLAAQDGTLHLDEPTGPDPDEGVTVRHLLAHASGLPPDPTGPRSTPGRRRIYSNWGYELLGELVADRRGTPFPQVLEQEVLAPLGMSSTSLHGSPAHGARGTVTDLLAFARELLRPRLLEPELHREATSVAFPGIDGVLPGFGRQKPNDWGLGFEVRDRKSPHWTGPNLSPATFGHFGQSGSFLLVDPEAGVAVTSLSDRSFGRWAAEAWPSFTDAVMAASRPSR